MNATKIEWTDFTANPLKYQTADGKVVWACVKVSPGCHACYAETLANRYGRGGPFKQSVMDGLTPFLDEAELHKMLTYKPASGKRCFVGDMTDVFGPWVPDELLDRLFAVFALRDDVTWQILTKRAERMRDYWRGWEYQCPRCSDYGQRCTHGSPRIADRVATACGRLGFSQSMAAEVFAAFRQRHLPNVWLGVSVEDQPRADERIPHLLATPAAVRFLSIEPQLSLIILHKYFAACECGHGHGFTACPNTGGVAQTCHRCDCKKLRPKIRWVICGGESGLKSRPFDLAWARSLRDQCAAAGVAFFMKQVGAWPLIEDDKFGSRIFPGGGKHSIPLGIIDRKGGDVEEWPADLRVRQFPATARA